MSCAPGPGDPGACSGGLQLASDLEVSAVGGAPVGARTAVVAVVAADAVDAPEDVVASVPKQPVDTGPADHDVVADAAAEDVVPGSAADRVVAGVAEHPVV